MIRPTKTLGQFLLVPNLGLDRSDFDINKSQLRRRSNTHGESR